MTFKDALHVVTESLTTKLIVPNWAMTFTELFRHVSLAFKELEVRSPSQVTVLPSEKDMLMHLAGCDLRSSSNI